MVYRKIIKEERGRETDMGMNTKRKRERKKEKEIWGDRYIERIEIWSR